MHKTALKKAIAIVVSVVMIWSFLPVLDLAGSTAYAMGGTVTFSTTSGINVGQVLHDGDLNSTDISGIQLDIYNANSSTALATSPIGSFVYYSAADWTLSKSAIVPIDGTTGTSTTNDYLIPKIIIIRSHDGTAFSFKSIYISDLTGAETSIRFEGFRSGTSVGYVDLPMDEINLEKTFVAPDDFGTKFQNVDEICITNQADGNQTHPNYIAINSIEIGDPPNAAPTASSVQISGTPALGEDLAGSYNYADANSDPQGTSTFKWYRYTTSGGAGKADTGVTTQSYTVTAADLGKYLGFEVTPVASTGASPGTAVESSLLLIPAPTVLVTFDPGSGSVSPETQTKLYGSTYGKGADGTTAAAMPTPSLTGFTFGGWWTGSGGTGTRILDSTTVSDYSAHTLHAKWTQNSYTVSYSAGAHGTLSGSNSEIVLHGSSPVSVPDVTPADTYLFAGWSTDGGTTLLTKAQVEATTVTGAVAYTAYYTRVHYTVSYAAGGNGSLTGSASESVAHGSKPVSVPTANPDPNYDFAGWSSDNLATAPLTTEQVEDTPVTGPITYTAYFSLKTYAVTYSAGAHGTLSGYDSETVSHGGSPASVPDITADSTWVFAGWSADSGTTLLTKAQVEATTVTGAVAYTAYYTRVHYTVSYAAGDHGSLSGSASEEVDHGSKPVSVPTATPDATYHFTGWSSDGGTTLLSKAQVEATAVTGAISYTAYFSLNTYTVSYSAGDHGSLSGGAAETVSHGGSPASVPDITADSTWVFAGWSSDSGTTLLTKAQVEATTVTGAVAYTAYYTRVHYTVSYAAGDHGSLTGASSESVAHDGSPASVPTVTPDTGYNFTGWSSDGGTTLLSKAQVEATTVTGAVSYTAYYQIKTYTVSYAAGAHGSLTGSASETVSHGGSPVLVPDITADSTWIFAGWSSNGGTTLLTKAQVEATTVTGAVAYTAYYTRVHYTVSYDAGAYGSLTGSASENVDHGSSPAAVPTITPDTGYNFTGWSSDGGTTLLTKAQVEATTVTGAVSYTAYYQIKTYTVSYAAGAHGSLTGSTSETVSHGGSPVSVPDVTADSTWVFAGWSSNGGTTLLTKAQVEAKTVTGAVAYTAYYTRVHYTVSYDAGAHGSLTGSASENVDHGSSPAAVPTITPDTGYNFTGWSRDGGTTLLSKAQVEATTVTGAVSYTAYYQIKTYTVSYAAGTHGTLTGSASEIVPYGNSPVSVPDITPDATYLFTGWTSDGGAHLKTKAQVEATIVTASVTYTACFSRVSYTVSYNAGAHGSLTGAASESVEHGSCPAAVPGVTADTAYAFTGWSSNGGSTLLTKAQVEATVVTGAITYTAYYEEKTFTVSYVAGTHGTLTGSSSEIVPYGNSPVLVPGVVPDATYIFAGWSSDGGTTILTKSQVEATTITASVTYTAYYTRENFTVTYLAGAHGSLIGASSETVDYGSSPTKVPIASASLPYTFTGWSSDGGTTLLTKTQVEATIVTGPITYTAYYSLSTFTVTYLAGAHGTLVGAGSESVVDGGHPANVPTVTPESNYTFTGWSCDGGTTLLTKAQVEATTVISAVTYTAYYAQNTFTVTYLAGAHGTLVGSASESVVDGGHPANVPTVTPESNYTFTGWSCDGGTTLLTKAQVEATTVISAVTYTAYYAQNTFTVMYLAGAHGTLVGAASESVVDGGHPANVPTVTPESNYTFTGWSCDGGTTLLTKAQVEATTVIAAVTYTAYYSQSTFTVTYLAGAHGTLTGAASETVADGGHPANVPTVTPESNYTFTSWSCDGGTTLLTKAQVEATTVIAAVTYTAYYATVTYTIETIADQTLKPVVAGYGPDSQQTLTVTITRTGTGDLKHLAVALGGTNKDSFTITQLVATELNSSAPTTTFTIKANDALPKGSYTADITISADSMTAVSFGVTQVVSENTAAKKKITFVVSDGAAVISSAAIAVNGVSKSTDSKGQAVYELANGTYGFSISKTGYTAASGTVEIGADSSVICLVMAKTGEIVLPDGDGSTDAILIAKSGAVSPDAVLVVDEATPSDSDNSAVDKHVANYHIASLFNIQLLLNNVAVQPSQPIVLGLPVPKALLGKTLIVVRINDDGTVTKFTSKLNGNMLFFTVSHLSKYAILSANEENPETGDWSADSSLPLLPLGAGVLLLIAAALVFFRKKHRI